MCLNGLSIRKKKINIKLFQYFAVILKAICKGAICNSVFRYYTNLLDINFSNANVLLLSCGGFYFANTGLKPLIFYHKNFFILLKSSIECFYSQFYK